MSRVAPSASRAPRPRLRDLRHLPGDDGWPVVGDSFAMLANPLAYSRKVLERYGPVSRSSMLFEPHVTLISADANQQVLVDRDGTFSAHDGWESPIGRLFPRGLLLRDGDDHHLHRRLLQPAFRQEPLADALDRMYPRILTAVDLWCRAGALLFYPSVKRITLRLAGRIFLGLELDADLEQLERDFTALVDASVAVVRVPVLGRRYARGLAARARLEVFVQQRLAQKRAEGGPDLLSQLCRATDESGRVFDDSEIVDHVLFLLMAAHDTTTSAIVSIAFLLASNPVWQARLRAELQACPAPLTYADLSRLTQTGWVFREALRLYPPLAVVTRRAVREVEVHGHRIPEGTKVSVVPILTQRLPRWWSAPDEFDPERFSPERAEHKRHPFAWVPFGGGAHLCLGLHFAELQVKAVLHALLTRAQLAVAPGYQAPFRFTPITRPSDGLPLTVQPLRGA